MTRPEFRASRQALRASRISDALSAPRSVDIRTHRDRLLELVLAFSRRDTPSFEQLREEQVDVVVSLALAEVAEDRYEALYVVLASIQVLGQDGQFARLTHLQPRLDDLALQFRQDRPFLYVTLQAFAAAISSRRNRAQRILSAALGISHKSSPFVSRDRQTAIKDLLCASSFLRWLTEDDLSPLERARTLALKTHDGLTLALAEALLFFARSASSANARKVVQRCDPIFDQPTMNRFVQSYSERTLFPAQIAALENGITLPGSNVVALPTSSGKTFLALLRIAAQLTRNEESTVIYVAPYRLLSRQVERELAAGLHLIGKRVRDIGSGFDPTFAHEDGDWTADVVVCTPERLDALLRLSLSDRDGSLEAVRIFQNCTLLVFDELHLVSRAGRGPRFELLLSRIRQQYPSWDILGLCAASHGGEDLAAWLADQDSLVANGNRPTGSIELAWQTDGRVAQRVGSKRGIVGNLQRKNKPLEDASRLVLSLDSEYRPVLIITTSRPNAENMSGRLMNDDPMQGSRWRENLSESQRQEVDSVVEEVRLILGPNHKLAAQITQGLAFHHAGIPNHVLRLVEGLAHKRILRVLCSTTTVAEGSDLPFRVVVIPMLNFESGGSRRLERDLYLNIVGRAGRANVAMEGLVFILESGAKTLHDLVPRSLWASTQQDRVVSRLPMLTAFPNDANQWEHFTELKSQVLAWVAEDGNYVENQSAEFVNGTFAQITSSSGELSDVQQLVELSLESLSQDGLALAGSPYRVTQLGEYARLGGLSGRSTIRLAAQLADPTGNWIHNLVGASEIEETEAYLIAELLFQSLEVVRQSLWLRWAGQNESSRWAILRDLESDKREWPSADPDLGVDIDLLAGWMLGASYEDLSYAVPVRGHKNSLFGGTDLTERTSDVAEQIGQLTYPAAWTWSAIRVILGAAGDQLPAFIRQSVELGARTAGACFLMENVGISRPSANSISNASGPTVADAIEWISAADRDSLFALGLPTSDMSRLDDYLSLRRV